MEKNQESPVYLNFSKNNFIQNIKNLDFPNLRFGDEFILKPSRTGIKYWKYAKENAIKAHGPLKQPIINKVIILYIDGKTRSMAERLGENVKTILKEWKMDICPVSTFRIENIETLDQVFPIGSKTFGAVFIIEPSLSSWEKYKDKLNSLYVPSQGIKSSTLIKLSRRSKKFYHSAIQNVVAGLVGKCRSIPWILEDTLSADCYIGLDSGGPKDKRSWSCAFVFDNHGRRIKQRLPEHYSKESIGENDFKKMIIEAVEERLKPKGGKLTNLIIHRDGILTKTERKGLEEALSALSESKKLDDEFRCASVNIKKSANFRLFSLYQGKPQNPKQGSFIVLDEKRAALCDTGYPTLTQGTTKETVYYFLILDDS